MPAPTPLQVTPYGDVVAVPMDVLPEKNSTLAIDPSLSLAAAVTVMFAGATNFVFAEGAVIATLGGTFASTITE